MKIQAEKESKYVISGSFSSTHTNIMNIIKRLNVKLNYKVIYGNLKFPFGCGRYIPFDT